MHHNRHYFTKGLGENTPPQEKTDYPHHISLLSRFNTKVSSSLCFHCADHLGLVMASDEADAALLAEVLKAS